MSHAVFMHRSDSIYDDSPAEHYQFPSQYLSRATPSVGDWILYLEPTKIKESRGYFAVARLERIIDDPVVSGMYRAIIEPGSYLEFPSPVPFSEAGHPIERGLLNEASRLSGRAQAAVRGLSPTDFAAIVARGLADDDAFLPRQGALDLVPIGGFGEQPQDDFRFDGPLERPKVSFTRSLRDRAFRRAVLGAYGERCAFTGLHLINGGGRAEVEAAHIMSVSAGGPDAVQNGLALCGTAHWMFDRGLLTLDDDLGIHVSRHVNDPSSIGMLLLPDRKALSPSRSSHRPHRHFLAWHRENCFKQ